MSHCVKMSGNYLGNKRLKIFSRFKMSHGLKCLKRGIQNSVYVKQVRRGTISFSFKYNFSAILRILKQGGGSLLDRMRGREEERSDPLTRTIRDR